MNRERNYGPECASQVPIGRGQANVADKPKQLTALEELNVTLDQTIDRASQLCGELHNFADRLAGSRCETEKGLDEKQCPRPGIVGGLHDQADAVLRKIYIGLEAVERLNRVA